MPIEKKYVPSQKIMGMQVIDLKGTMVGSVKDVAFDVKQKDMALVVATKARTEIEVPWSSIQSIEDVVLLGKEIELPSPVSAAPQPSPVAPPIVQASSPCPNCGTMVPSHGRFCPKCGAKLR